MPELLVLVPSRGRPASVERMVDAWTATGAYEVADLLFGVDEDDVTLAAYQLAAQMLGGYPGPGARASVVPLPPRRMAPQINQMATRVAANPLQYRYLGCLNDDHIPRTFDWAQVCVEQLAELGTGIVYGDDLYQGERLPTWWVMTADIVQALGRMVPAPVEHLYADNSILDLGTAAGCIRYLPDVVIEHMHPVAGKAEQDDGYRRANSRQQYQSDGQIYRRWLRDGLAADVAAVRVLQETESPANA